MKRYLLLSIPFLLFACGKEPLVDVTSDMVGSWKHYTTAADYHIIRIYDDGQGVLEWYNADGLTKTTPQREWYIKDNRIYFGKAAFNGELYDIDEYPQTAAAEIINGKDTIYVGEQYCILDGSYYRGL